MKVRILKLFFVFIFVNSYISASSQDTIKKSVTFRNLIDSTMKRGVILNVNPEKPEIVLSRTQAMKYLERSTHPQVWKDPNDSLRKALSQLLNEASQPPYDSLRRSLMKYPYDSLNIRPLGKRNQPENLKHITELKDTTIVMSTDTLSKITSSYPGFPFRYINSPYQGDSIKAAVISLLKYLDERDSTIINFTGLGNAVIPIMLNSKEEKEIRYWLKNEFSDSVAVWISNPSRNRFDLSLEKGINLRRPVRQGNYASARTNVQPIDNKKILELKNITVKIPFWKYHTDASFVLNQASLSNWVKGGESSISTAMDITGYADYYNKPLKVSSNNFARIKFGYIASGKEGIRKNIDLLETNSKLNHKAFGKFDFSAILLFKTQIARGLNYFKTGSGKDTSNLVSKFMNPAILTIGFGLDYKPNKNTSINFSPFSYKGTFVTDTVHIDQTQYGIAKNRKSLNEPGVSFMITNEFRPVETVTIVNRLQLFTNYIHNPQNVDVDWEMIVTAKLNWFTDVRFNTHLIFDDDTRTAEQYQNGQSVLRPDGTEKRTARIQFKEMLGFSLFFRF